MSDDRSLQSPADITVARTRIDEPHMVARYESPYLSEASAPVAAGTR